MEPDVIIVSDNLSRKKTKNLQKMKQNTDMNGLEKKIVHTEHKQKIVSKYVKTKFICSAFCGKTMKSIGDLLMHLDQHMKRRRLFIYECLKCHVTRRGVWYTREHLQVCYNKKLAPYQCHLCLKWFHVTDLKEHKCAAVNSSYKVCTGNNIAPLAQLIFSNATSEEKQKGETISNDVDVEYICSEFCGKTMTDMNDFEKHLDEHIESTVCYAYECLKCEMSDGDTERIRKHLQVCYDSELTPCQCRLCFKWYREPDVKGHRCAAVSLSYEESTENDIVPLAYLIYPVNVPHEKQNKKTVSRCTVNTEYTCSEFCGTTMSSESDFVRHLNEHLKSGAVYTYQCLKCHVSYRSAKWICQHLEACYGKELIPHQCYLCLKWFYFTDILQHKCAAKSSSCTESAGNNVVPLAQIIRSNTSPEINGVTELCMCVLCGYTNGKSGVLMHLEDHIERNDFIYQCLRCKQCHATDDIMFSHLEKCCKVTMTTGKCSLCLTWFDMCEQHSNAVCKGFVFPERKVKTKEMAFTCLVKNRRCSLQSGNNRKMCKTVPSTKNSADNLNECSDNKHLWMPTLDQGKDVAETFCCSAFCGELFTSVVDLESHLKEHEIKGETVIYKCNLCEKDDFKIGACLAPHFKRKHRIAEALQCTLCQIWFASTVIERHQCRAIILNEHDDEGNLNAFPLSNIVKTIENKIAVTKDQEGRVLPMSRRYSHQKDDVHNSYEICTPCLNIQIRCYQCGLLFKESSTLVLHFKIVHGIVNPQRCDHCMKWFVHSDLESHICQVTMVTGGDNAGDGPAPIAGKAKHIAGETMIKQGVVPVTMVTGKEKIQQDVVPGKQNVKQGIVPAARKRKSIQVVVKFTANRQNPKPSPKREEIEIKHYRCIICEKTMKLQKDLAVHLARTHVPEIPGNYSAQQCLNCEAYCSMSKMGQHLQTCCNITPSECALCLEWFSGPVDTENNHRCPAVVLVKEIAESNVDSRDEQSPLTSTVSNILFMMLKDHVRFRCFLGCSFSSASHDSFCDHMMKYHLNASKPDCVRVLTYSCKACKEKVDGKKIRQHLRLKHSYYDTVYCDLCLNWYDATVHKCPALDVDAAGTKFIFSDTVSLAKLSRITEVPAFDTTSVINTTCAARIFLVYPCLYCEETCKTREEYLKHMEQQHSKEKTDSEKSPTSTTLKKSLTEHPVLNVCDSNMNADSTLSSAVGMPDQIEPVLTSAGDSYEPIEVKKPKLSMTPVLPLQGISYDTDVDSSQTVITVAPIKTEENGE